jgi:hypothetical protein
VNVTGTPKLELDAEEVRVTVLARVGLITTWTSGVEEELANAGLPV